jgi:hypothetical protein
VHDSSGIACCLVLSEWIIMDLSTIEPDGGAVVLGCPFAGSRAASRPRPRPAAPPSKGRPLTVVRDLPTDALGLARVVTQQVRERGKHVLSASLREAMVRLRANGVQDPFVGAFLDCLLESTTAGSTTAPTWHSPCWSPSSTTRAQA